MRLPEIAPRGTVLVIGLVFLFAPVFILVVTLGFLVVARGLVLGELSAIELLELYLLELLLFGGFAFLLYRFVSTALERRLPAALDELERSNREREPAGEVNGDNAHSEANDHSETAETRGE